MTSFLTPAIEPDGYIPYRALPRWQTVDMDLLDVREGHSVLDIGCGDRYLLRKAARRASLALGVDLDECRLRTSRDGPAGPCHSGQSSIEFAVAGTGYCLGTGNTPANYVPLANYLAMLDEGRRWNQEHFSP